LKQFPFISAHINIFDYNPHLELMKKVIGIISRKNAFIIGQNLRMTNSFDSWIT